MVDQVLANEALEMSPVKLEHARVGGIQLGHVDVGGGLLDA